MFRTFHRRGLLYLFFIFFGIETVQAQQCDQLGLVTNGFLLGKFNCEVLIISSDGAAIFQPAELTDELTMGQLIQFSYEILDSTDCADDVPLINITCIEPFFETIDSILTTCNFAIESTSIVDTLTGMSAYQLEVYNQTDFGAYHPQSVQWYEYETGRLIGEEAIVIYTPTETSPPVINICADIIVQLPEGNECISTLCHTIIPESVLQLPDACQALFVYQPKDQLSDNGMINFYNLSFGNYDQILWDFGDGQTDTTTASTFDHTYTLPGLYEVCLTIQDGAGDCSSTFCLPVFTVGGSDICNFNDCVLPGDANKDGIVDIFDVLNLGLGFNQMGEIRPNAVIDPILQAAFDWTINSQLDLNFKHIDCDGNGVINALDYEAIDQNYQKNEKNGSLTQNAALPVISLLFETDTIRVSPNQEEIYIPLNLVIANTDIPITNFHGIAFSLDYSEEIVQSIETTYDTTSFIGDKENVFVRQKNLKEVHQLGVAITRTNQEGKSGSGKVAEVGFVVIADLIGGRAADVIVDLNDLVAVDENGQEIPVSIPSDEAIVTILIDENVSLDIEEKLSVTDFDIYPNPAKESIVIDLTEALTIKNSRVEIFNTLGQKMLQKTLGQRQSILDISGLETGIYWAKIYTKEGMGIKEIVVEK